MGKKSGGNAANDADIHFSAKTPETEQMTISQPYLHLHQKIETRKCKMHCKDLGETSIYCLQGLLSGSLDRVCTVNIT